MHWRRISFYLGVPLVIGLYGASQHIQNLASVSAVGYVMLFLAHSLVPFWISCLSTQLVTILFAALRPPLTARLIIGGLIASIVVLPYASWLAAVGPPIDGDATGGFQLFSMEFIIYSLRATLIWVGVNLLYDHYLGLPRYRYTSTEPDSLGGRRVVSPSVARVTGPAPAPDTQIPEFLLKSGKVNSAEDIYSVSAEEHYVKIHTSSGDMLIYKRFSDAVKELAVMNGMRIHRSHWVSPYAVADVIRAGKRMSVCLRDGTELPVSRPYQAMVNSLAEQCGHLPR